jgi:hypothetical protein
MQTLWVEANRGEEDEWHQESIEYGQNYWNLLTLGSDDCGFDA